MFGLQSSLPPLQSVVPAAQSPGRIDVQAAPDSGFPSSVKPSQLLSTPSHFSALGVPSMSLHSSAPMLHSLKPSCLHAPTPTLHGWPYTAHGGTLMAIVQKPVSGMSPGVVNVTATM